MSLDSAPEKFARCPKVADIFLVVARSLSEVGSRGGVVDRTLTAG